MNDDVTTQDELERMALANHHDSLNSIASQYHYAEAKRKAKRVKEKGCRDCTTRVAVYPHAGPYWRILERHEPDCRHYAEPKERLPLLDDAFDLLDDDLDEGSE